MAYKIMVQGTMSSAGKSFIVTGLCRLFARAGFKVCPFKSQNMALNSYVTKEGLEMGRAQVAQAEAAGEIPNVKMNPVLLKPTTDVGSQVIVLGKSVGNMPARQYYEYKTELIPVIKDTFKQLEQEYDVIVIEGAGSPAEINLRDNDIVNMGLAEMVDAPVLLVGDVDLGGVFAQLLGTTEWLTESERNRVRGFIINKFRGDVTLLKPGVDMLTERTGIPTLGVVPMTYVKIDEEDSITKAFDSFGEGQVNIAVIRLPRISNFTDFGVFETISDAHLYYVNEISELGEPDIIILPGTKSTISDLKWLKETGLYSEIIRKSKSIPIFAICGGYQMLGDEVLDPLRIEGSSESESGLGLLPLSTTLDADKTLTQKEGTFDIEDGFFSFLNGQAYKGYEIHQGISTVGTGEAFIQYHKNNVYGTYIHGVFDAGTIAGQLVDKLLERKGLKGSAGNKMTYEEFKDSQYDILADALEAALDMKELYKIMGIK